MRNEWFFNGNKLPEYQVIERAHFEWTEFRTIQEEAAQLQLERTHQAKQVQVPQQIQQIVGYYIISTSSIFQHLPRNSSVGILAWNPQHQIQHASATIKSGAGSPRILALEAIRSAQLLAYQSEWKKVIIQTDAKEIIRMIQQHQQLPVELSAISEDISLLTNLFDDCIFSFGSTQLLLLQKIS